jgi:hypothetical protein
MAQHIGKIIANVNDLQRIGLGAKETDNAVFL